MENKKKVVVTHVMNFPFGIGCEKMLQDKMKRQFPKCDYIWEAYALNWKLGNEWNLPTLITGTFDAELPNKVTWKVIHY